MNVFYSCNTQIKNKSDLQTYIGDPNNGLTDTVQRSSVLAKLVFQPWQLLAKRVGASKTVAIANTNPLSKNLYFVLSLSKDGKELLRQLPFEQYSEMIQVFSFRMQDFISVKADGSESIAPIECLFQQTYGMTEANMLMVVFEKKSMPKCEKLNFYVKEFGLGLGELTFQVKNDEIGHIERLDYLTIL